MKNIKLWPHVIVTVIVAALLGLGLIFYLRHEQTASAAMLPNAARIQHVDGEVALSNSPTDDTENAAWIAAATNQPFSVGDRIYTRDKSSASLAFSGRNFARLEPNTSLDLVALADDRTQLALRDGSAMFDVGYLEPGQLFEVGTPHGAVDFMQPGLYDIGFDQSGNTIVSVLSGLAQVVGLGGRGEISKGEMLTLLGQTASEVVLSRLNRNDAGYLVDDYYRYQYPDRYDGRYVSYDTYLGDPYYYDPYRHNASYRYVTADVPGINDLDYYGNWQDVAGYGYAWSPQVDASWNPYQEGYWVNDYPYGPTWVSTEPWGYTPYHYGRWANVGNRWYWIPDSTSTPLYSPALVAFVPLNQDEVGWVPLGPGDPYVARYYDTNWQPHYLTRTDLAPNRLVNLNVPGAITVVTVDRFNREVDRRSITRIDPRSLANIRPTLEPLTLSPLRNAVIHSAWGRGKIDLPPGIARKLQNTPVVVSAQPIAPPFRRDLARSLRLQAVPDKVKGQKLKFRDARNGETAAQIDPGRRRQMDDLAKQAARDNQDRRQQFERQQLDIQRQAAEQARQAEQQQRHQQMDAERAQRQSAEQSRQQERRRQMDQQRAARQVAEQARQAQQQQRRQQMDAERALRQAAEQSRQGQQQQRRQQMDAERAQRRAAQQAQGERVSNPAKGGQPKAERGRGEIPREGPANPRVKQQQPQKQPPGQSKGGKGKGKP